ncbi:hypothetical protein NHF45_10215 [Maricaulaceae bacterium NA33B04]|nr:hypothetical protein [Maricaulaceae bacterium NA33B04]
MTSVTSSVASLFSVLSPVFFTLGTIGADTSLEELRNIAFVVLASAFYGLVIAVPLCVLFTFVAARLLLRANAFTWPTVLMSGALIGGSVHLGIMMLGFLLTGMLPALNDILSGHLNFSDIIAMPTSSEFKSHAVFFLAAVFIGTLASATAKAVIDSADR